MESVEKWHEGYYQNINDVNFCQKISRPKFYNVVNDQDPQLIQDQNGNALSLSPFRMPPPQHLIFFGLSKKMQHSEN